MRASVFHSRMAPHRPGSNHVDLEAARRERDLRHALALDLRRQCEDAGISQAALARAAHLSTAQVSRLLSARESPSLRGLIALSVALDARIILRIDPVDWSAHPRPGAGAHRRGSASGHRTRGGADSWRWPSIGPRAA